MFHLYSSGVIMVLLYYIVKLTILINLKSIMPYLNYNTIFYFLEKLPAADGRYYYEEIQGVDVPLNWKHLGALNDDKIRMEMEVYKLGSHYAIGFYPFNGCDIYQDEQGRVLLSYVEFGGHLP